MLKIWCIIAGSLSLISFSTAFGQVAQCPFEGTATSNSGVLMACPKGDGPTLVSKGLTISVRVLNAFTHQPIEGIPANEMWLVGSHDGLYLCGGSAATHADGATNLDGRTTFSGPLAVGGCDEGLYVVIQGSILVTESSEPYGPCNLITVPIAVRSVDLYPQPGSFTPGGDGVVSLSDWSLFVSLYQNGNYDKCADFDGSGQESIGDLTFMQAHYPQNQPQHACP